MDEDVKLDEIDSEYVPNDQKFWEKQCHNDRTRFWEECVTSMLRGGHSIHTQMVVRNADELLRERDKRMPKPPESEGE